MAPALLGADIGIFAASHMIGRAPDIAPATWQVAERVAPTSPVPNVIEVAALAPLHVVDHEPIEVADVGRSAVEPDLDEGFGVAVAPPSPAIAAATSEPEAIVALAGEAHGPHDQDHRALFSAAIPAAGAAHASHDVVGTDWYGTQIPVPGVARAPHDIAFAAWTATDGRARIHGDLNGAPLVAVTGRVIVAMPSAWPLEERRQADFAAWVLALSMPEPPLPDVAPDPPVVLSETGPDLVDESFATSNLGPLDLIPEVAPEADDPISGLAPVIAIVIDDLGLNRRQTAAITALPGPLTMAFIPYAGDLAGQTAAARASGHEIFLHLPMEPIDGNKNPGPNALLASLSDAELQARLVDNLDRFTGYVGVNNHMGSRLTQDGGAMAIVMAELKHRDLMFLDSVTIGRSIAHHTAVTFGVPSAERDVFLDNVPDVPSIMRQLAALEAVANRRGYAIAIGHPHQATVAALAQWLPDAVSRGFRIVPASEIIMRGDIILAQHGNGGLDDANR
ncbi:MAG: divergent polysaccharide deacetylase family protein [Pseudomonadota bacterium]